MKKFLMMMMLGVFTIAQPVFAKDVVEAKPSATGEYGFDKAHTQILFFVSHLGFSMSQGEFLDYDGAIMFDDQHPEKSSVDVTIQTSSIDMDDEKWDEHMKSKDFFDVENFPTMTFKSTSVELSGDKVANIVGDLTILGVTKPVTLATTYNKSDIHPYSGKFVSGFSATTNVKRSDFGMTYGLPGVGDDIEIRIEVEAMRKNGVNE